MTDFNPTIDTFLQQGSPTTNSGAATSIRFGVASGNRNNSILHFDISSLSGSVASASLTLEIASGAASAIAMHVYRLTQTAWVEAEATWNIYSSGNNWVAAGGDFTTDLGVAFSNPTGTGPFEITGLGSLIQEIIDSHSGQAHLILTADGVGTNGQAIANSSEGATQPVLSVVIGSAAAAPLVNRSGRLSSLVHGGLA